jgi:hypothetical protein
MNVDQLASEGFDRAHRVVEALAGADSDGTEPDQAA